MSWSRKWRLSPPVWVIAAVTLLCWCLFAWLRVGVQASEGDRRLSMWLLVVALAATSATVLGLLFERLRVERTLLGRRLLHVDDGRLPHVDQVDPVALGVRPAITGSDGEGLPTYVPRDLDADLDQAISAGGMVLVHGPAASGKTRTAVESLRRVRPHHQLLAPASPEALRDLLDGGSQIRDAVVWLDDLERYLTPGGIDLDVIGRLCADPESSVAVVATIRDRAMATIATPIDAGEWDEVALHGPGAGLLGSVRSSRRFTVGKELSREETDAAIEIGGDRIYGAVVSRDGFAAHLAAGPALMARWSGEPDAPAPELGQAVVSAAVDCRRAGFQGPVPARALKLLVAASRSAAGSDALSITDALTWAQEEVFGAAACLRAVGNGFIANDYLLEQTASGHGPLHDQPISDLVWDQMLEIVAADAAFGIGVAAFQAGHRRAAAQAFEKASAAGHAEATHSLGLLLRSWGERSAAVACFRRAASAGHPDAMHCLADLLAGQAVGNGRAPVAYRLGARLKNWSRPAQSATWMSRAMGPGRVIARRPGDLLMVWGEPVEAATWFRRAAGAGHVEATYRLALVHRGRDETGEALDWLRRAAEAGHVEAMNSLADLLTARGATAEAVSWLRRAEVAGEADRRSF